MELQHTLQPKVDSMNISEYARKVGVSRRTVYNWINEGRVKTLPNRKNFIDMSSTPEMKIIEDFLSSLEVNKEAVKSLSIADLVSLKDEIMSRAIKSGNTPTENNQFHYSIHAILIGELNERISNIFIS